MASPTTVVVETFSASIVRHTTDGIEGPGVQHHLGPAEQPHERHPLRRGVHQGRKGVEGEVEVDDPLERSPPGCVTGPFIRIGSPPARQPKNASSIRHTTPLGSPVVPPV